MNSDKNTTRIPLQVGAELRIKNDGAIVVDNPEIELTDPGTADAVLSYRFDPQAGEHVIRLLEPVADRKHLQTHRKGD